LENIYTLHAELFKALSDANRIMIIDMLSCGELCACEILEQFNITQPTLSYHMSILCGCGLVIGRKEGKWMYYSLNDEIVERFKVFLSEVTSSKGNCICHQNLTCKGCCD
jgi:ArsR family transcriptional regulator